MEIRNFGRNVTFHPSSYFEPRSENEILEILSSNPGRRFRTVGRLHSWSEAPSSNDVVLNLKHLDGVTIEKNEEQSYATVGAGCQIKRLIKQLNKAGLALPTQGLITEQTIAGAISTGTHGSGKQCLSHFADEITAAVFDRETGEPVVKTFREGPALLAAKCSLGCLGVILSVRVPCQPQYRLEEHLSFLNELSEVLEAEDEYPLQQFFVVPHLWKFLAQHRKVTNKPQSSLAPLYQAYWFLAIDVGLHLILLLLAKVIKAKGLIRFFYQRLVGWTIVQNWKVTDQSQRLLTIEHELFRHIEIEIFVRRSKLEEFLRYVRCLVNYFDGDKSAIDESWWNRLQAVELSVPLDTLAGTYTHHYPICVRKVLPDNSFMSMASGSNEPSYAVSFISYHRPKERGPFNQFAQCLAETTSQLFDARPHWGKVCPIKGSAVEQLYPKLPEFQAICESLDPHGLFRNTWANEKLFGGEPVQSNSVQNAKD